MKSGSRLHLEHLHRLRKRAQWLEARIAIATSEGRVLSFDAAELSSLTWAIRQLDPEGLSVAFHEARMDKAQAKGSRWPGDAGQ